MATYLLLCDCISDIVFEYIERWFEMMDEITSFREDVLFFPKGNYATCSTHAMSPVPHRYVYVSVLYFSVHVTGLSASLYSHSISCWKANRFLEYLPVPLLFKILNPNIWSPSWELCLALLTSLTSFLRLDCWLLQASQVTCLFCSTSIPVSAHMLSPLSLAGSSNDTRHSLQRGVLHPSPPSTAV